MILWPRLRTLRSRGQKRCGIPPNPVDSGVPCRLGTLGRMFGIQIAQFAPWRSPDQLWGQYPCEASGALIALNGQEHR